MKKKLGSKVWGKASGVEVTKFLHENWEHGIKPQFDSRSSSWLVDLPESFQGAHAFKNGIGGLKRQKTLELSS